ncbi:MAG: hypothetical protein GX224_05510 [Thermoplasmatales archaeon]|nr:hypothetical protein [Thermoplasmatales archaeon]
MFWSKGRAKSLFFTGAMLAFIGLGLHLMGHSLVGALSLSLGMAMIVIGMAVLRMLLVLEMRGVDLRDAGRDR